MARKVFCCTDNLLVLPVAGVFVALLGLVLLIIYLVARGITSSLHLVEGPIPTYVAAIMLILAGTASIILLKKRHLALIVASVLLSIFDVIICIVLAITTGLVSIPFLGSFSVCVLRASSAECQCYVLGEGQSNGTVIIPGADTKHYTFNDVRNCGSIETTLADFLYTLCIVYGFGALGSLFTAALSLLLICGERRSSKDVNEEAPRTPSRNRQQGQQNLLREEEDTTTPNRNFRRGGSVESPAATTPQASVSHHREGEATTSTPGAAASGTRQTSRSNLPQNRSVQRSSSVTTTPATASGSRRPTTRYHSVAGAEGGRRNGSSQRPQLPVLVRGGYLQIRLDGPRIPVYTLHGTNEAYIALTDLPRLQLPALDQVPAYVPELPDLPNYEPPPYSPTANNISESPEGEQNVSGGVERASSVRQQLNFEEEVTTSLQDAESTSVQDATIDEPPYIPLALAVSGEAELTLHETGSVGTDDQRDLEHDSQSVSITHEEDRAARDIPDDSSTVNDDRLIDSQPPDILVEAIESARSSLNVTASNVGNNLTSDSTESGISLPAARGDDGGDQGHNCSARPGHWPHSDGLAERSCQVVPGPSSDSSTSGDNFRQLTVAEECSTDDQSTDRNAEIRVRLDSRNIPCDHSEEQSSDPQGVLPNRSRTKSAAATVSNTPPRHHTDQLGYGSQSRSSKSRRPPKRHSSAKDLERPRGRDYSDKHRSRSRSPNKDTSTRESGKSTRKVQRWHSIQNDQERHPKKVDTKRSRRNTEDYGNPSRSRRYAASSTENLSDIISLVETVRGTSSRHSTKRHREQKKKSKSKVGLVDSKV